MGPFEDLDGFKSEWAIVRAAAEQAGRDLASFVVGRLVLVCVDKDRDKAREALGTWARQYFGTFDVDKQGVWGTADEVATKLRAYVDAGMNQFMLGLPNLDPEQLRAVAEEVAPVLRA
jgi:alkanesulfonate monooxygenase SsuD/methylene tetrahydromethanopterin reductase-like flavin-dependent oxidoreductase (luciferase family)